MSRTSDIDALRDMIERIGAVEVVNLVGVICEAKANDAIEEGDEELADEWEGLSEIISDIEWEQE